MDITPKNHKGRWIEPFMGTGVVGFNANSKKNVMCDTNPHLINFYHSIKTGKITSDIVRDYLIKEGYKLLEIGEEHYYHVRNRFNEKHNPLDFLFINRSGFNGMLRFNKKGGFNIPFCRKPNRFAKAYITKIVNQVEYVSLLMKKNDFTFKCQDFKKTISEAKADDTLYCDPPYIDRHVDYYNSWNEEDEHKLFSSLSSTKANFILSTWHHNDFRANKYIESLWGKFHIYTREHFYHVGGSEKNRNSMIEAIITNFDTAQLEAKNLTESLELTC